MTTSKQQANLKPFEAGSERARELGRKGGQARARKQATLQLSTETSLNKLTTAALALNREDLGHHAATAAQLLIAHIISGQANIQSRDYAELIKTLVDVARLEAGQPTGLTGRVEIKGEDLEKLRALREQATSTELEATTETTNTEVAPPG